MDSDVWVSKPAWWLKVWVYILTRVTGDGVSDYPPGMAFFTLNKIYKHCRLSNDGVGIDDVGDVVNWLILVGQIEVEKTTRGFVARVSNYNKYQGDTNSDYRVAEAKKLIVDVLEYLNKKSGRQFKRSANATRCIGARIREGFKFDDFKKVIDSKVADWKDSDMAQYIRPQTLFGTKFEGYLRHAEAGITKRYSRYDPTQLQV